MPRVFDPSSKPGLVVHSRQPFNAEPPLPLLRRAFETPGDAFYVRSHGAIPLIDAAAHRVTVDGLVRTTLDLSLDRLRERFPAHTVQAVMQCAGNRRADLQPVRPTAGDPWAPGAIGNARWTGVRLSDLLRAAGADTANALHVAFEACDDVEMPDEGRFRYGVSIPMPKALSPEVLVAWAMNGEALAPEHGYPVRMVVPGFAGVRSPKWLRRITVQDRPSDNHMQQRDYKLLPPDVSADTVNWSAGVTINEMPLNAAICEPASWSELPAGTVTLRGYAIATGRRVTRVDVSADGGRSWRQATLEAHDGSPWSWLFWNASLDLPPGEHELAVRAWDGAGQTQPGRPDDVWNFKGYLCAAWHRIRVRALRREG
jgi:sulfite oxidase